MLHLKPCQEKAVNELLYLIDLNEEDRINFQAPTGAGKTFIMSNFCNRLFKDYDHKTIILFSSISIGDIHYQNYEKFEKYKSLNNFIYNIHFIDSPSNSNINKTKKDIEYSIDNPIGNDIYFIGTSSFKKGSILYERNTLESTFASWKNEGYRLIYIRDEAHIGTDINKSESKNLDNLVEKYFDKFIYISATLNHKNLLHVQITEKEAENDNLIKSNNITYLGIEEFGKDDITSDEILKIAIDQFKDIQAEYKTLNTIIRPAMLIQISDKSKFKNDEEERFQLNKIKNILDANGLKYALYTSNTGLETNCSLFDSYKDINKFNKHLLTDNNSLIDVIIFKVSLATGWDIPRACMLVQLREVFSDVLDKQTIGRIRRNPMKDLEYNSITNAYYIYSNFVNKNTKNTQFLKLNEHYINKEFFPINVKPKYDYLISDDEFINRLNKYFNDNNFINLYDNYSFDNINKVDKNGNKYYRLVLDKINDGRNNLIIPIYNVFDLLNLWNEKVSKNINFYSFLNIFLNNYCKDNNLNKFQVMIMLLSMEYSNFLNESKNIFKNLRNSSLQYEISNTPIKLADYTIQEYSDEKQYVSKENEFDIFKLPLISYYPRFISNLKNAIISYYFDSNPEKIFFNTILKNEPANNFSNLLREKYKKKSLNLFELLIKENPWKDNSFFIIRNYLENSKIRFEYISDQDYGGFLGSYPDFILSFNDIYYFLEIKSINDYDEEKTEKLINAYKEFSKIDKINYYGCIHVNTDFELFDIRLFNNKENIIEEKLSKIKLIQIFNYLFKNSTN